MVWLRTYLESGLEHTTEHGVLKGPGGDTVVLQLVERDTHISCPWCRESDAWLGLVVGKDVNLILASLRQFVGIGESNTERLVVGDCSESEVEEEFKSLYQLELRGTVRPFLLKCCVCVICV